MANRNFRLNQFGCLLRRITLLLLSLLLPSNLAYPFRALILRHGQTDANAQGIIQGSSDRSRLTPLGQEQAKEVAVFLKDPQRQQQQQQQPNLGIVGSVYCSPLLLGNRDYEVTG
jgi:hypothetical protein